MTPSPHHGHDALIGRPTVSATAAAGMLRRSLLPRLPHLAAGLVLAASFPAWGQDTHSLNGTTVTIRPSERAGAIAQIDYSNKPVNGPADEISFDLICCDLTVVVVFDWNADALGSDAIAVTPPEGVTCLPVSCILTLPEGEAGTVWLFSLDGVGM